MLHSCGYARLALVFGLTTCLQSTAAWSAASFAPISQRPFFNAVGASHIQSSQQVTNHSNTLAAKNFLHANSEKKLLDPTSAKPIVRSNDNLDHTTTGSIAKQRSNRLSVTSSYVPTAEDMAPAIEMPTGIGAKDQIAGYQILLDRAGASPGAIDGRLGSNVDKAAAAYGEITGKYLNPADLTAIEAELNVTGGSAFKEYVITNEDVGRQYVASIPSDYAEKAQLQAMAYTSVTEMLGERFQIDDGYLKEINPGVNFNQPGSVIRVPNLSKAKRAKVNYIVADKARKQVRGYDVKGSLVVAYPATIGSSDTPSPSGTVQVKRIAINPNYTYNPRINFKQGNNEQVLTIPPGPNGPVGTVWIALSKPTYGIHGTPDPSRIGKTSSHGCVRLTNWDAEELAKLVKSGVVVQFTE
ncbi:L,D-transpeptidase [Ochrobactrum sp. BTU1]|uniref:L,D-transpeptidase n=1 Tax=Ochrobactrum sp. BTU1 TaxID=2840456 RepID=UPI004045E74F